VVRLTAKQQTGIAPLSRYITAHDPFMTRLWPAYSMRHRPILARLVFSNEKAWWDTSSPAYNGQGVRGLQRAYIARPTEVRDHFVPLKLSTFSYFRDEILNEIIT